VIQIIFTVAVLALLLIQAWQLGWESTKANIAFVVATVVLGAKLAVEIAEHYGVVVP
jgi:hypothetical protein